MFLLLVFWAHSAWWCWLSYTVIWAQFSALLEKYSIGSSSLAESNKYLNKSFSQLLSDNEYLDSEELMQWIKLIARIVFSATITSSINTVLFISLQLLYSNTSSSSGYLVYCWDINITMLVLSLVFVQPALTVYLLINKLFKYSEGLNKPGIKLGSSLMATITWLVFITNFHKVTDFDLFDEGFGLNLIQFFTIRISILGITLIAILNGIGSVSNVYYNLVEPYYTSPHKWSRGGVSGSIARLKKNCSDVHAMAALKHNELRNVASPAAKAVVEREIGSLKLIEEDISMRLSQLEKPAGSYSSLVVSAAKYSVTAYSMFKIIQSIFIQLFKVVSGMWWLGGAQAEDELSHNESDPIVVTISHLIQRIYIVENEQVLVNQLSFLISVMLFIASLNGVILTLRHFYRLLSLPVAAPSAPATTPTLANNKSVSIIKNLIISEITGIYILATILILKSNLSINLMKLLNFNTDNNISIVTIDNWYDKIFFVVTVLTSIAIKAGNLYSTNYDADDLAVSNIVDSKIV